MDQGLPKGTSLNPQPLSTWPKLDSPLGLHIRIWLWHWTTGCRVGAAAAGSGSEVDLVARSGEAGGEEEEEEEEENCVWQRSCVRDWGMPW